MSRYLLSLVTILIMAFAVIITPAYAQDYTGPDTNVPATGTTVDDNNGFSWWWLLPLLAIPLVIPFFSRRSGINDRRTTRSQATYHELDRDQIL